MIKTFYNLANYNIQKRFYWECTIITNNNKQAWEILMSFIPQKYYNQIHQKIFWNKFQCSHKKIENFRIVFVFCLRWTNKWNPSKCRPAWARPNLANFRL